MACLNYTFAEKNLNQEDMILAEQRHANLVSLKTGSSSTKVCGRSFTPTYDGKKRR
eukprot:c1134_g1_i1 orf=304-471(+)